MFPRVHGVYGLLKLLLPRAVNGVPWLAKNQNSAALILQQPRSDQTGRGKKNWHLIWHLSELGNTDDTNIALLLLDSGDFTLTALSVWELQRSPLDECELTIKGMQHYIKWISAAAGEAVAKFQRFWRDDPSGTMTFDFPRMADPSGTVAFHFPRKILLTHSRVYFLLSFVLVSVVTILWKERKVRQVQSGATFSLERIESASKGQSLQQEFCERSIVYLRSHANFVI